jgi:N-acetylated-alpha-linked acidic dipeptidase
VLPFLLALNGHGISANDLNKYWRSGGLWHKDVKYNIGPAPGIQINLVNEVDYVITPQWDVIGKIEGYVRDEVVILGNHRDAWVAGGAGDPNSGTAALVELARTFGSLLQLGWKPARTVILASWDGEEYGLLGSTEWVEDHAHYLAGHALAYLNVDVGSRSGIFKSAANPLLHDVIHSALKKVPDPKLFKDGNTTSLHKIWNKRIATLGSGSDYTSFQDFLGIPSVDMGFSGSKKKGPIYHYHSNYDSFHWMDTYGDPGFLYHAAMTKVWGLMALNLIESPIVPFNATKYAVELGSYLDSISEELPGDGVSEFADAFTSLKQSIKEFLSTARKFDAGASDLSEKLQKPIPWWRFWERMQLLIAARTANQKYKFLDRAFVYEKGLDGRNLFKHVVYAPGQWTGYAGDTFPGIVEAVRDKDWANATVGRFPRNETVEWWLTWGFTEMDGYCAGLGGEGKENTALVFRVCAEK